jgi:hypothetical protein
MTAALSWLASQRGLLLVGLSLLIGVVGYLLVASWTLWRVRRKGRDLVDLCSTGVFVAGTVGLTLALETYGSVLQLAAGVVVAGAGYAVAYAAFHAVENSDARR